MKRRNFRLITCCMLVFHLLFLTVSAHADRKVRVAFFYWPGYNVIHRDGTLDGYGYQYLRELAKYTDWEYEFITEFPVVDDQGKPTGKMRPLLYEDGLWLLQTGQADLMDVLYKTPQRANSFGFPDWPSGEVSGTLVVRGNDTQYQLDNITSFDNMRIGIWNGTPYANELRDFFEMLGAKNVQVKPITDPNQGNSVLHNADTIDGVFSFNSKAENERAVLQMGKADYYFITRKDDPAFLTELNTAQAQIQIHTPHFQRGLQEKYFSLPQDRGNFVMKQEEKKYVAKHPVLRVSIDVDNPPFSFRTGSSNQVHGITAAVMQEVAAMTGMRIKFVPLQQNMNAPGQDNQWDVLAASYDDYSWADERGIDITSAYLHVPLSMVTNSSVSHPYAATHTLAITHVPYVEKNIQEKYHYSNIKYYSTDYEAVQAVNAGDADVVFVPAYQTETLVRDPRLRNIVVSNTTGIVNRFSIGVRKDIDPILFRLLNKAVNSIPEATLEHIIIDNTMMQAEDEPVINMIYRHPFIFAAGVSALLLILYFAWYKWRSIEQHLEMSEKRFRIAVLQSNLGIWDYDIIDKKIIQDLDAPALKEFGKTIENAPQTLVNSGVLHPNSIGDFLKMHEKLHTGVKTISGVFRFIKKNVTGEISQSYWSHITYTTIFNHIGKPIWAVGVAADVTTAKNAEMEILNAKKYEALALSDVVAKYKIDVTTGKILEAVVLGEKLPPLKTKIWDDIYIGEIEPFVYPDHRQNLYDAFCKKNLLQRYKQANYHLDMEFLYKHGTENYYWVTATIYLIKDENTGHVYATLYIKNINEQKRHEMALKEEIEKDPLTALYNRKFMQHLIINKLRNMQQGYFMIIDLDNFKYINDHYGHAYGDIVLKEFGNLLLQIAVRKGDVVGRLGGDEFVIFLDGDTTASGAQNVAVKIKERLSGANGLLIEGRQLPVSCSIGIAHAPEHGGVFEELYQKADTALYKAKHAGKNCYCYYAENGTDKDIEPFV
jgi:diguanylate cyclase (GGDEF)-like protein